MLVISESTDKLATSIAGNSIVGVMLYGIIIGDYAVMGEGALKRVNYLAFTDYWKYKNMLADKNARKHVPAYNPQQVAKELGFYGTQTL